VIVGGNVRTIAATSRIFLQGTWMAVCAADELTPVSVTKVTALERSLMDNRTRAAGKVITPFNVIRTARKVEGRPAVGK
jgi:hypothetical protein